MKAREYLEQLRQADKKCEMIAQEIDALYAVQLQAIKTESEHGNGDNDKTLHTVEKILELKDKYQVEIEQLMQVRENIVKTICSLDDAMAIKIVYLHTCQFMPFREIAIETDYSESHAKRIYYDALRKLDKTINDNTK